ncbi:Zinc finger protein-likeMSN2 [Orchesella cincta]|uniref:Zinc finger protein-likeMSN2 n=1 Tax=Orchesella cincta TaxID=48709 RepID=A0A1D2M3T4_ORCCI|nr:Zinc finger protein-likeMSN2 [Orchesella cincta]
MRAHQSPPRSECSKFQFRSCEIRTKGFKCGKCPKGFKSRHELRKHEAKIHPYLRSRVCVSDL